MSNLVKLIYIMNRTKTVFMKKNITEQFNHKMTPCIPDCKDENRRGIQDAGILLNDNDIVNLDLIY